MASNDPTNILGAVLSDEDIRRIIAEEKIFIKTPREEDSKDFYNSNEFDNAIEGQRENPSGCLESAGYLMKPYAYWNGKDFIRIGRSGYVVKPNQHTVIKTFQWIKFSKDYCAFHFGLHRNQMVGVFVGSGQIQPEWGPAPLYVTIWNSGKANFAIKTDEAISRLIFTRMTSSNITGRYTLERVVRDSIKQDLAEQAAKEVKERIRVLVLEVVGIIIVVGAFFVGPLVLPFLGVPPRINDSYGGLLSAALAYILLRAIDTLKGFRK